MTPKQSTEEQLAELRETSEPAIGPNPGGLTDQARLAQTRDDDEPRPDPAATTRRGHARRPRKPRKEAPES